MSSVQSLARTLNEREKIVRKVSGEMGRHYRKILLIKADKSRECWDPSAQLRRLQKRIVTELLIKVEYPYYLHGGLPGRDYLTNAEAHVGAYWGYCVDVKNFFPSIARSQVFRMWNKFFGFSPDVSGLLSDLTTHHNFLPQGSLTASYIANLILWQSEWEAVRDLKRIGFVYTRFIDDITITCSRAQSRSRLTQACDRIHKLTDFNNFRIKRSKSRVLNSQKAKLTLGIDVSGVQARRTRRHRKNLTSEVFAATGKIAGLRPNQAEKYINSLRGRLTELRRFSPLEADRLLEICPKSP